MKNHPPLLKNLKSKPEFLGTLKEEKVRDIQSQK
jgi:hypothetical protein